MTKPQLLGIEYIHIPKDRRQADEAKVATLAESIKKLGLKYPITVRRTNRNGNGSRWELVAGLHRLKAAKKNGDTHIAVTIDEGTETAAGLWEIAENLHRAELSAQERGAAMNDYVALLAKDSEAVDGAARRQLLPKAKTRPKTAVPGAKEGRRKSPITRAAEQLGVPVRTAREQVQVGSITDEAQAAAKAAGIVEHKDLLVVARKKPADQVRAVKALAIQKRVDAAFKASREEAKDRHDKFLVPSQNEAAKNLAIYIDDFTPPLMKKAEALAEVAEHINVHGRRALHLTCQNHAAKWSKLAKLFGKGL